MTIVPFMGDTSAEVPLASPDDETLKQDRDNIKKEVREAFELPGPNFIALLTGKQIFVLTIAEKFA